MVAAALEKHRVATGLEELRLEVRTLRQKNMNMKMQLEEMEKMMDANIEDRERVISQRKEQIIVLKKEKEDLEAFLKSAIEEKEEEVEAMRRSTKEKEEVRKRRGAMTQKAKFPESPHNPISNQLTKLRSTYLNPLSGNGEGSCRLQKQTRTT